jgi:hypothetical protein
LFLTKHRAALASGRCSHPPGTGQPAPAIPAGEGGSTSHWMEGVRLDPVPLLAFPAFAQSIDWRVHRVGSSTLRDQVQLIAAPLLLALDALLHELQERATSEMEGPIIACCDIVHWR